MGDGEGLMARKGRAEKSLTKKNLRRKQKLMGTSLSYFASRNRAMWVQFRRRRPSGRVARVYLSLPYLYSVLLDRILRRPDDDAGTTR